MAESRRVESLDYLRGLMALSVMVYHYSAWTFGPQLGVLGKLGIYAVAAFYVLSGVSLGMVYRDRLGTGTEVSAFWIRRLFRIVPLFWLATAATLAVRGSSHDPFLNFSLLFSVLAPSGAIATGAWSIGNELVFYALLPLVIRAPRWAFVGSVALAGWYACVLLSPDAPMRSQWDTYAQPMNHLFLFVGGVVIVTLPRIRFPAQLGALAVVVFCAYPMAERSDVVAGWGRLVMSSATLAVVLSVYQLNPTFKGAAAHSLAFLGQGCYSIYLLHPIVRGTVAQAGADGWLALLSSVAITLGLSYLSFKRIEKPMMDLGARLSRRRIEPAAQIAAS